MKKRILSTLLLLFLTSFYVSAIDVAYIYKNKANIQKNVINTFLEENLTVNLIQENNLNDLSNYKILFIGDETFRNKKNILIGKIPSLIQNHYYTNLFGLTDRGGAGKFASNSYLYVNKNNVLLKVYSTPKDKKLMPLYYYYLGKKNKLSNSKKIATTYNGNLNYQKGDVISYIEKGTLLKNKNLSEENICFFGIPRSEYWTIESKNMFKDCINFLLPQKIRKHDVSLLDFKNSIGKIRIQDENSSDILQNDSLICNKKYKIIIKLINNGDYIENVSFNGNIANMSFSHNKVDNLKPLISKIKLKTISINSYFNNTVASINIETVINNDSNLTDNLAQRNVSIVCS